MATRRGGRCQSRRLHSRSSKMCNVVSGELVVSSGTRVADEADLFRR